MFFGCWTFYQRFAEYIQGFPDGQILFVLVAQAPPQYPIQVKVQGLQTAKQKWETKELFEEHTNY